MSFLNPVNESVLRFSSTDAGAPQINYNARVAGDVKTVLKACLVTGYGAKASAGWSIVNEVDHVAEFVSPSVAMSDYRLGIDDTSTSSTTWYYQYQYARVNPSYNVPTKSFSNADKTNSNNGWQLFVTQRGILFIEIVQHTTANKPSTRITYWGQVKSALVDDTGKNIAFFNIGHNGAIGNLNRFFGTSVTYNHGAVSIYNKINYTSATTHALVEDYYLLDVSLVDLVSPIYMCHTSNGYPLLIAKFPPMLSKIVNKTEDLYGISEIVLDGRNTLSVCAGYTSTNLSTSRTFLIYLDYWEY